MRAEEQTGGKDEKLSQRTRGTQGWTTPSSLPLPPGNRYPRPAQVRRQRACSGRFSPPPFCEPPFHPGNRRATTARARAGRGPGGAGRHRCALGLRRRRPYSVAVSACPTSFCLLALFSYAFSGPEGLTPSDGLPESKRGGAAARRGRAGGGRGAPWSGQWARWGSGAWPDRGGGGEAVRPSPPSQKEESGARRAAGTAPGDPGWPLPYIWSCAPAPPGKYRAVPMK